MMHACVRSARARLSCDVRLDETTAVLCYGIGGSRFVGHETAVEYPRHVSIPSADAPQRLD